MALRDIVGALRDEEFWRDIGRNTRGIGELGIEFAEGAVGEIGGGITGLGKLATGSSFEEAGEAMENVQDWAGSFYEPKYQETEDYMQSIGGAVQPLVENFDTSALWLEDNFGIPRELTKGSALAALELSPLKFAPTKVPDALRRYNPNTNIGQTVPPRDVLGYTPDNLNFDYGDMPFDMAAPVATTGGASAISNFIEKNVPLVTGLNVVPEGPRLSDALRTTTKEVDELGFFSRALDEAKNLKQEKGTGQQMKAMLLKAGVKQDEIDWTGLDKILDQPKVTKTEIVDYLSEHQLKFGERVARGSSDGDIFDWGDSELIDWKEAWGEDHLFDTQPSGLITLNDDAYNFIENHQNIPSIIEKIEKSSIGTESQKISLTSKLNKLEERLRVNQLIPDNVAPGPFRPTEIIDNMDLDSDMPEFDLFREAVEEVYTDIYSETGNIVKRITDPNTGMTITGSDDLGYQVFTSPEDSGNWENAIALNNYIHHNLNEAKVQAEMYARDSGIADEMSRQFDGENRTQWSEYQEPGGENYQEIQFTLASDELPVGSKAAEIDYESPHFDNPDSDNMIFHIRATDRTTPDGKKVLYIEELQSDWGQQGRKRGFELKGKEKAKAKKRLKELTEQRYNHKGFNLPKEKSDRMSPEERSKQLEELQVIGNEIEKLENNLGLLDDGMEDTSRPPTGPFVGETDKWTSLAIKRLIAKAQKEGYDQISFSPGDVQYSRWGEEGLRKYYDEIIPKVAKKITKKMDNVSVEKSDVGNIGANPSYTIDKDGSKNFDWPLPQRFTIKLSPDKEFEGFPYMSLAPFGAAPIVESLRQEQPIY